jgi:hypothetical protein
MGWNLHRSILVLSLKWRNSDVKSACCGLIGNFEIGFSRQISRGTFLDIAHICISQITIVSPLLEHKLTVDFVIIQFWKKNIMIWLLGQKSPRCSMMCWSQLSVHRGLVLPCNQMLGSGKIFIKWHEWGTNWCNPGFHRFFIDEIPRPFNKSRWNFDFASIISNAHHYSRNSKLISCEIIVTQRWFFGCWWYLPDQHTDSLENPQKYWFHW